MKTIWEKIKVIRKKRWDKTVRERVKDKAIWKRVIEEFEKSGTLENAFEGLDGPDYAMDVVPSEESDVLFAKEPVAKEPDTPSVDKFLADGWGLKQEIVLDETDSFVKKIESILGDLDKLAKKNTKKLVNEYLVKHDAINPGTWKRITHNIISKRTICSIAIVIFSHQTNLQKNPVPTSKDFLKELNELLFYHGYIMSPFLFWDALITNCIEDGILDTEVINEYIDDANEYLKNNYPDKCKTLPRLGPQEVDEKDRRRPTQRS
jgi:hypothetical protein